MVNSIKVRNGRDKICPLTFHVRGVAQALSSSLVADQCCIQLAQLTTLDESRKEGSHRWPHFLPDGRHFVFFSRSIQPDNEVH
jgi:hypothetical protein